MQLDESKDIAQESAKKVGGIKGVNKKKYMIPAIFVIAVIVIIAAIAFSKNPTNQEGSSSYETDGGNPDDTTSQELNGEDKGLAFPYLLEDGKLEVTALFQSDIPNPDNGYQEGKNLASIELVNKSEDYLESADISITLAEGTKLSFQIRDIPAGKTVWAFEKENIEIAEETVCESVTCEAKFASEGSDWTSQFQTNSENAVVTITNLTNEKQEEIKATFHCLMEDTYFGGVSYEYSIDVLLPEESTNVEVTECYLGEAETVRIITKK